MRRISHLTKDAICWARNQTVAASERLEHWGEAGVSDEAYEELSDIHEALIDGFRDSLTKLFAIEVREVADEVGLKPGDMSRSHSAFPDLVGTDIEIEDSILDYCTEMVGDIFELTSVPAITIADEFEEWLNDLYEWHTRDAV